jgi:hypothetical protein
MDATQDGITSLVVNANGRSVNVNLGGTSDGAAGTTVEVHQRHLAILLMQSLSQKIRIKRGNAFVRGKK